MIHKLLALIGLSAFIAACGEDPRSDYSAPEIDIRQCLITLATTREPFDVSHCLEESWDEMLIFGPYSDPAKGLRDHGILVPSNLRQHAIQLDDTINLLVFILNGRVVAWTSMKRIDLAFGAANVYDPIPREEAVFLLSPDPETGWPAIHLVESGDLVDASVAERR